VLKYAQVIKEPSETEQLSTQLNAIGLGITWQNTQNFITASYSPILSAIDAIQDEPSVVTEGSFDDVNSRTGVINLESFSAWSRAAVGSGNDTATDSSSLPLPLWPYSPFGIPGCASFPNCQAPRAFSNWKEVIAARNTDTSQLNQVYDWRLGAPFLLK